MWRKKVGADYEIMSMLRFQDRKFWDSKKMKILVFWNVEIKYFKVQSAPKVTYSIFGLKYNQLPK